MRLRPIDWTGHPAEVTLPQWRALVAEVLDAARRSSRTPAPATLDTVLALIEAGEGSALAGALAAGRGLDAELAEEWSAGFASRLLTAAIGVAAVDSHRVRPTWAWPTGVSLQGEDGRTFPAERIVAETLGLTRAGAGSPPSYGGLRARLAALGVDVHEPLWLDLDDRPRELPVGAFVARGGLARREVVVTDHALHVFRVARAHRPTGPHPRPGRPGRPGRADELRQRMLAVWQGDTSDEVATLAGADVARARFGPATGGLWWVLSLRDGDRSVLLRGAGDGVREEATLRRWLGGQLVTTWVHAPAPVRAARDLLGRVGTGLGAVLLVLALAVSVLRPGAFPESAPLWLAAGGLAALVVALLPELGLELVLLVRQRLSSPTGTSTARVLPAGARGQAQDGS